MKICYYTTRGPVRDMNQDGVYVNGLASMDTAEPEETSADGGLFAVVDGMGGVAGGEVAAALILEGLNGLRDEQPSAGALERGLLRIQRALRDKPGRFHHMGAALAGVWLGGESLAFNCGDCRAYLWRSGFLEKITHDHSLVQELYDNGAIDEEEMRFHPRKNILTSALSADDPDPQIFCAPVSPRKGDKFLIMSDGLWECLSIAELENCMGEPPALAAAKLKKLIWEKKARDNASFIIVDLD